MFGRAGFDKFLVIVVCFGLGCLEGLADVCRFLGIDGFGGSSGTSERAAWFVGVQALATEEMLSTAGSYEDAERL